jgi:hypothetical protein
MMCGLVHRPFEKREKDTVARDRPTCSNEPKDVGYDSVLLEFITQEWVVVFFIGCDCQIFWIEQVRDERGSLCEV